jgi:hypothetical protein
MIELSMEVPEAFREAFCRLCDQDFALAHRVLEDASYAYFYRNRAKGRELILDNSMHELGEPLAVADLLRAARTVRADYVISPDRLGDPDFTFDQFQRTHFTLGRDFKIAVVMAGKTPSERHGFLNGVVSADMLCLPYREDRLAWFKEQVPSWNRIHLLGVSSADELREWVQLARAMPERRFSVDTSKPIKWALADELIELRENWRGAPTSSRELLTIDTMMYERVGFAVANILHLRSILRNDT